MSAGESFISGSGGNHNVVPYGDHEEFSWWKTNFYSYVMGLDEKLCDILEDGVGDLDLDEEGAVVDRKKHTPAQKNMYKKHHKIRGSLVLDIPYAEYMKMSDKSTAKTMFASPCVNYEGRRRLERQKHLCLFISMNCSR